MLKYAPAEIDTIYPAIDKFYIDLHQNPELAFQEVRTAKLVAAHLKSLGLQVRTGVGGNGVVGILKGDKPGPVVGLRADMDDTRLDKWLWSVRVCKTRPEATALCRNGRVQVNGLVAKPGRDIHAGETVVAKVWKTPLPVSDCQV